MSTETGHLLLNSEFIYLLVLDNHIVKCVCVCVCVLE